MPIVRFRRGVLQGLLAMSLAVGLCGVAPASEPGTLPSLDLESPFEENIITPVSELIPEPASGSSVKAPASGMPQTAAPKTLSSAGQKPVEAPPAPEPAGIEPPAEIPAVDKAPRAHRDEKNMKPVSYSPLPAIVVFPVVKHGHERAFGDLPLIFAREYAQRLEAKAPETKVYHPIYSVDEIRMRGMGHVYDQIMDYYKKAGRPEPAAMDYLLKQLADDGKTISRVVFVEADLDMSHPAKATGLWERVNQWLTDGTPTQMKYFVRSRMQIFDAENPEFPMVWGQSWDRSIKTDSFYNVLPSVYMDSDSQQAFARLSRQMSREILALTPKKAYMAPQYDLSVQGELAPAGGERMPNFSEMKPASGGMNDDNRQAIQRILRRQHSISP